MPETAITPDDVLLVPAYNHHESLRIVDIGMTDAGANTIRKLQGKLNYLVASRAAHAENLPHKLLQ